MAWFWFIVLVVVLVLEYRYYSKVKKVFKRGNAQIVALSRVVGATLLNARQKHIMTAEEAVDFYLTTLGYQQHWWVYDDCLTELCKAHGLQYKINENAERTQNADRIDPILREKLVKRLADSLEWDNGEKYSAHPKSDHKHTFNSIISY